MLNILPQDLHDVVLQYLSFHEKQYLITGDLGWVLHRPKRFDSGFLNTLPIPSKLLCEIAAAQGNLNIVIQHRSIFDNTAFEKACKYNQMEIVKYLWKPNRSTRALTAAIKNDAYDVIAFWWSQRRDLRDIVYECCKFAKPNLLDYIVNNPSFFASRRAKLLHHFTVFKIALHSTNSFKVSQWIQDQYLHTLFAYLEKETVEEIATATLHFTPYFLIHTGIRKDVYAGNVSMLTWITRQVNFTKDQWIQQSKYAILVNDVALFRMCHYKTNDIYDHCLALSAGHWEMFREFGNKEIQRDTACSVRDVGKVRKLQVSFLQRHHNVDVWHEVLKTQIPTRSASLYVQQLYFMLPDVTPLIPDTSCEQHAARCEMTNDVFYYEYVACLTFASADNVYWFAKRVLTVKCNREFYSHLVVICIDKKAYHCLGWMKDNGYMQHLLPILEMKWNGITCPLITKRELKSHLKQCLKDAPQTIKEKFKTKRSWGWLLCMLPVVV